MVLTCAKKSALFVQYLASKFKPVQNLPSLILSPSRKTGCLPITLTPMTGVPLWPCPLPVPRGRGLWKACPMGACVTGLCPASAKRPMGQECGRQRAWEGWTWSGLLLSVTPFTIPVPTPQFPSPTGQYGSITNPPSISPAASSPSKGGPCQT